MEVIQLVNDPKVLLTEQVVANAMGVTLKTLRKKRSTEADHPPFIKVSRNVRYPSDHFYKWICSKIKTNYR